MMLQGLQNTLQFRTSVGDVLVNIVVAFLCGMIVAFLYRTTYRGPGYSASFLKALVILCVITSVVIMVIGNNLARAFGLVGAMSIIRFRTAVKETHDIVFIFYTLAIGMAAGVGYHALAITGTVSIGLILLLLTKVYSASPNRKEFLLQFAYSSNGKAADVSRQAIMQKYCKRDRLLNARSDGGDDVLELSYYVELKNKQDGQKFIGELKKLEGVDHVNLFFDEERF